MKNLFTLFVLLLIHITLHAQYCSNDERYTEVEIFSDNDIELISDVQYAIATDFEGNDDTLLYDVLLPSSAVDTAQIRPCVMVIHGGGFVNGSKMSWRRTCLELAQRGFVAITINYRLGYRNQTEQIQAIYRAQQDANAALRHIVHNASTYKIDTSWIFIAGGSAGSITALNTVYNEQSEWNSIVPGIQNSLGRLDNTGNTLTDRFTLKGVYNNWGFATGPFMQVDEMVPTISFHGELDTTVPIDTTIGGGLGSRPIHNILTSNGICSELNVDSDGGHGIYRGPVVDAFRAGRASCFFKSIFCNTCSSLSTTDSIPATCSITTSVEQSHVEDGLMVYPNPFSDRFHIDGLQETENFVLLNAVGKIEYQGKAIQHMSFAQLPKGIYFLPISRQNYARIVKLFKQ
jgi:poly(3-hydroxybutyrate) depolymerase